MTQTESSEARASGRSAGPSAQPRAAITCAMLRDWVRAAQPGARLIYGYGGVVAHACSAELRELVMALYEKGFLRPHRTKIDDQVAQIVVRTERKVLNGEKLEAPAAGKAATARRIGDELFRGPGR